MAPSGIFYTAAAAAAIVASFGIASAAPGPCSDECAGMWQQCGGQGTPAKECCDEGFFCYELAEPTVDYMQCRRPNSNGSGWEDEPNDCDPHMSPNLECTGEEGAPPILVKIGQPFTIATSTTPFPDLAFCEVVGSTMAPILPLSGTVSASETDITRTLMCTVKKNDITVTCKFDVTLFGEPNIPSFPLPEDTAMAAAFAATAEDPPEDIIVIV